MKGLEEVKGLLGLYLLLNEWLSWTFDLQTPKANNNVVNDCGDENDDDDDCVVIVEKTRSDELTFDAIITQRNENPAEAVFLVVCDPSMNEVWATDLSRSLTARS